MKDVLQESLYKKSNPQYEQISMQAKAFAANYCGNTILRDTIFGVVLNYAKQRELAVEILRYPFGDDELWAFTFVKAGTVFLCVNSDLALNKQIFAVAHELYHIHCYAEEINQGTIKKGSILDSRTVNEYDATYEDLEANAFAGLILMPDLSIADQMKLYSISREKVDVDDILTLMELFAMPYKAVVLRLFESEVISEEIAHTLLTYNAEYVAKRIELTGKSKQWAQNSRDLLYLGSLLDNLFFNTENELLTDSREESDKLYLTQLMKGFRTKD